MATSSLDAKQLHEAGKQIFKAAESGDPPSVIMSLLAPLENVKATEDLLRQSKIGVAVTRLRQNKDPKVSEAATRLVNKWKQEVNVQGKKKKPADSSPAPSKPTNGTATNGRSSSGTSSPAPPTKSESKPDASKRQSKVDPEKRNTQADGIDTSVTGDKARDGCVKLMYDGLAFLSDESPDTVLEVARSVEAAAYDYFKQETNADYRQKMRSLFQNLKMKGNIVLRSDVLNGKIEPKKFGRCPRSKFRTPNDGS